MECFSPAELGPRDGRALCRSVMGRIGIAPIESAIGRWCRRRIPPGETPRCVRGSLMEEAEAVAVFRYLDFLRDEEPEDAGEE